MQEPNESTAITAETPDCQPQQAATPMLCIGCGLYWLDWSGTEHKIKSVWSKTHQRQLTPGLCEACEPAANSGQMRLCCPHGIGQRGQCGRWIGGKFGAKAAGKQTLCPGCRRPIYWTGGFPPKGWSTVRARQKTTAEISAFNPAAVDQLLNENESLFEAFSLVTGEASQSQDFNRNDALELLWLTEVEADPQLLARYLEINESLL